MTKFYAQTTPGVEGIAWLEIRHKMPEAVFDSYQFAKEQHGLVLFDYEGPPKDLLQLRTTEDIFITALALDKLSRGYRDVDRIAELVFKGEAFGQATKLLMRVRQLSRPPTYQVAVRRIGKHEYRPGDVQNAVLRAMQARLPRWTAVAQSPQVEVRVNLLGSNLLIGFRLSNNQMRRRYPKMHFEAKSFRASTAAAMILLTQPTADDIFLDPLCGNGLLLLERRAVGPAARLIGGDNVQANVNEANRLAKGLTIRQWETDDLPLNDGVIDAVATVLPGGKRKDIWPLYTGLLAELARVMSSNGRIVLYSHNYELVKEALRQQPTLQIDTGYSVRESGRWGRIYIIRVVD